MTGPRELPFLDAHDVILDVDLVTAWARLRSATSRASMLTDRGFPERELDPPRRMRLAGSHPFAVYELRFDLAEAEGSTPSTPRTRVRATTHALFKPGLGKLYGALVVGSGGHKLVVRRFLRGLAR